MLTLASLRSIMPRLSGERAAFWLPYLVDAMREFGITTPARAAAFLAQAAHESAELSRLVEGLNYSAAGLRKTWPTRFRDDATAAKYARKPTAIANRVYANRLGNGPESSGDGWRYRGRGIFQLTGKSNYEACGAGIGMPLVERPELLEHPEGACRSAGWYWRTRGLTMAVDAGEAVDDPNGPLEAMVAITKRINGGLIGLEDRLLYWQRARKALAA